MSNSSPADHDNFCSLKRKHSAFAKYRTTWRGISVSERIPSAVINLPYPGSHCRREYGDEFLLGGERPGELIGATRVEVDFDPPGLIDGHESPDRIYSHRLAVYQRTL